MKFRQAPALRLVRKIMAGKAAQLLLASLAMSIAFGSNTFNLVTNFNASNNGAPSSAFSYGEGVTPGAFVADGTTTLDCKGTPTACDIFPSTNGVIWNGTGGTITVNASSDQPNTVLYIDPGQSAGIIVRFTAPVTDFYSVSGAFSALDSSHHTTNGSVYANGVLELGPSAVGAFGSTPVAINLSGLALNAGQTIDFIVTSASDANNLSTALAATITEGVPEPGSLCLVAGAALGLAGLRRIRRSRGSRFYRPNVD